MKFSFKKTLPPHNLSITEQDWSNWQWQLRKSPKTIEELKPYLNLSQEEILGLKKILALKEVFGVKEVQEIKTRDPHTNPGLNSHTSSHTSSHTNFDLSSHRDSLSTPFSFRVTPYYLSLINASDEQDPLRRIAIPQYKEFHDHQEGLFLDPLGEKNNNPTKRIIHRYSDRVLFLITDFCSVYCRYCTRKHFTGQEQALPNKDDYTKALEYIKNNTGIREVILSGGDPLTLSNSQLNQILSDLRSIDHIEILRLGTRMPVVCPMRIDNELCSILTQYKPLYLMTHFNHPKELTEESAKALELLANTGTPLMNQMVLLNGVNNHPAIIQALCRRLLYLRVKPYYLFQCDPSLGSDHLRTPIEEGEALIRELWGHLSGLAMPTFSLDIPDGGGKTTLVPSFEIHRSPKERLYKGWDGIQRAYTNPNPSEHTPLTPSDYENYTEEWSQLKKAKQGTRTE
jgi:lysine 2,3-aminomutase